MAYRATSGKGISVFGKISAWLGLSAVAAQAIAGDPNKGDIKVKKSYHGHFPNLAGLIKGHPRTVVHSGKLNQRQARKRIRQGGNAVKLKQRARG